MTDQLKKRAQLMEETERYVGMPTLIYDDIIDYNVRLIISLEKELVKTCECCGGEIIPAGIESLHYVPENGLCAGELPDCEVVA